MEYEANWATYVSSEEDQPILLQVDLSIIDYAPLEGLTNLAYLIVDTKDKTAELLPSEATTESMNRLDEEIVSYFSEKDNIVPVGITSQAGEYTYFFYIGSDLPWGEMLEGIMQDFPEFDWQSGIKEDPSWECYFEYLYPNIFEMQVIHDLDVLQQLSENGDDGNTPRNVKHWAIFSTQHDAQEFCLQLKEKGYEVLTVEAEINNESAECIEQSISVKKAQECEEIPEGAFEVSFQHTIAPAQVSDHTLELIQISISCQGEYDGWETDILNEEDTQH